MPGIFLKELDNSHLSSSIFLPLRDGTPKRTAPPSDKSDKSDKSDRSDKSDKSDRAGGMDFRSRYLKFII